MRVGIVGASDVVPDQRLQVGFVMRAAIGDAIREELNLLEVLQIPDTIAKRVDVARVVRDDRVRVGVGLLDISEPRDEVPDVVGRTRARRRRSFESGASRIRTGDPRSARPCRGCRASANHDPTSRRSRERREHGHRDQHQPHQPFRHAAYITHPARAALALDDRARRACSGRGTAATSPRCTQDVVRSARRRRRPSASSRSMRSMHCCRSSTRSSRRAGPIRASTSARSCSTGRPIAESGTVPDLTNIHSGADRHHAASNVNEKTSYAQDIWMVVHHDIATTARIRAAVDLLRVAVRDVAPLLCGEGAISAA